ncbi:PDZ and LIM domain protein 2 [Pelobates fuscus]|uniref:PDZ and LIM domain protein 2 n=1 Tax=Pelobates fuscus TaxID=191477 RepID=UPI002FE46FC2
MSWHHEDSEVYKMLQGNQEKKEAPRQSNSFRLLQVALEGDPEGISTSLPSRLSPNNQKPIVNSPPAPLRQCEKCHSGISDVAVRITEGRYRHPACYVCTDCGLNLKMRGHFWAGDDLVCEKHARARHPTGPPRT